MFLVEFSGPFSSRVPKRTHCPPDSYGLVPNTFCCSNLFPLILPGLACSLPLREGTLETQRTICPSEWIPLVLLSYEAELWECVGPGRRRWRPPFTLHFLPVHNTASLHCQTRYLSLPSIALCCGHSSFPPSSHVIGWVGNPQRLAKKNTLWS